MCGVGAELGQAMNELAFDELDAPVARLHTEPLIAIRSRRRSSARCWSTPTRSSRRRADVSMAAPPVPWHWRYRLAAATPPCAAPAAARSSPPAPQRPRRRRLPPSRRSTASRSPCPSATSPSAKARSCAGRRRKATRVKAGELVAEIETDKAVVEIEAPVAGVLARIEEAGRRGREDGRPHRRRSPGLIEQHASSGDHHANPVCELVWDRRCRGRAAPLSGHRLHRRPRARRRIEPIAACGPQRRCHRQLFADRRPCREARRVPERVGSWCAPASASTISTSRAGARAACRSATPPTTAPPRSPITPWR